MLKFPPRWMLMGACILLSGLHSAAQDLNAAVTQFAAKITERVPAQAASVVARNQSDLTAQESSGIQAELLRQLAAKGWKLTRPGEAGTTISVTFAENSRNYVWTAEISRPQAHDVVIFEVAKARQQRGETGNRIALARSLLISSEIPLLDAAILEGRIGEGSHLLALTPTTVQLYQLQAGQWRFVLYQPLARDVPGSRDLRGRIVPDQGNSFDAYLPATHCAGVVSTTLSLACRQSDDPWPLTDERRILAFYAARRNYFNGVISGANPGENVDAFYSAAVLSDQVVYSGVDGVLRTASTGRRPTLLSGKVGSNLAGIQSACHSDLVLGTSAADFTQSDSITAFLISNSGFTALSDPLAFSGPILNLKTSADRQQAIAIVFTSGRYEAYLLTAHCGA